MTSTHRPSGIRKFASALATAAVLAVGGVAIIAAPAHADPENVLMTLSVVVDPDVPDSALLHAEMTGPYIDAAGAIPAGTWSFLVADDSGATLFAQDVAQPTAGPTIAEVVWTDVPAGVEASAIIMYVPSESAEQFAFAGAAIPFASEGTAEEATELNQSEVQPTAVEEVSDPFPLWLGILIAAAILLAAVAVILLLRRRKKPSIVEASPET